MTAAYLKILIHATNDSLFPGADPGSITWTGPPPEIVTVQSLLYASLATSLFASFLAMLGKQWTNRYLRNHGGSAADKSRDRQRKLDGLEEWHFRLVIESLPVMLQLALLLLGCALSRYLWTISHTVAVFILTFTLFGVATYISFTLVAALSYDCPYQTPPSIFIRISIRYITQSDSTFARSFRSLMASIPSTYSHSTKSFRPILRCLQSVAQGIAGDFGHAAFPHQETPEIPLAVAAMPGRIFEDARVDWGGCKADTRCVAWVLSSTTDSDVIYSTVRFAADMIWYPEIAGALSPHTLANLFFECLLDGQVIPDKLEHASSVGMALASVLSVQLCVEPENRDLRVLCERIDSHVQRVPSIESIFGLVVAVLRLVARTPSSVTNAEFLEDWTFKSTRDRLPTMFKLWLSRVTLQTFWRWRRVLVPNRVLYFYPIATICEALMADGDQTPVILKTDCILIMAISLGLVVDIHDLYAPVDQCVFCPPLLLHYLIMYQGCIGDGHQPPPPTLTNYH